ncbi:MAG: aminotransferase class I/II-fold pyridoxal phosphate-dependent enzyme [Actinobacteria bacterium]|nr:aminotransferase class I/II-fold pyridoxal phosphate-dependent enzyme [Actinomycetota bacterium]
MGYRAIDLLVERFATLGEQPVIQTASKEEMELSLHEPPPAEPSSFDDLLDRLTTDVLPFMSRGDHPRFFAYIPTSPTWPSVIGDLLATGFNIYQGAWVESAGPSEVELVVIDWFRQWVGYPDTAGGILLSGGSAANMTALAAAADEKLGPRSHAGTIYVSTQAHSSVLRAARVLGFPAEHVRIIPVDDDFRMRVDELERAITEDSREGCRPFFVVANAGTTNTGSVDPLVEIAALCAEHGLWLQADAAYGGFAALTERGQHALHGLSLVDSITLDPHKWLYQPLEAGCCLVRDRELLRKSFYIAPDYLRDAEVAGDREINFSDVGIQLSRRSRALKIWLSLQYFSVDAYRSTIDRCLDLTALAQDYVRESQRLELLVPATLGVLCFRCRPDGMEDEAELERLNGRLVSALMDSGRGMVSTTVLEGRRAVRLCVLNHSSTEDDVLEVLRFFEEN